MEVLMRPLVAAFVCVFACANNAVLAEPADSITTENGRYSMTPVQDGFLRLDTRTGTVAMCRLVNGAPECRPAADERAALENEIGRLQAENRDLRMKAPGPGGAAPPSNLPSEQDTDKA